MAEDSKLILPPKPEPTQLDWHKLANKGVGDYVELTEQEQKDFHEFFDFLTTLVDSQTDHWVAKGYFRGDWFFDFKDGKLSLKIDPEKFNGLQREHISNQVWEAFARTPNKFFSTDPLIKQ